MNEPNIPSSFLLHVWSCGRDRVEWEAKWVLKFRAAFAMQYSKQASIDRAIYFYVLVREDQWWLQIDQQLWMDGNRFVIDLSRNILELRYFQLIYRNLELFGNVCESGLNNGFASFKRGCRETFASNIFDGFLLFSEKAKIVSGKYFTDRNFISGLLMAWLTKNQLKTLANGQPCCVFRCMNPRIFRPSE